MIRSLLLLPCLATTAYADPPAPGPIATYALVVGSNSGGPGQANLRYAEDDAKRVGDVLVELGGYTRDQVDIALHPTPDELRDRLAKLGARVSADAAAGKQTRIFFYYSGHARAAAIDLGNSELPLTELRTRLFAVPATLTVVVLDACQSGAFSRIKGAAPAADFSYSSRQHLDASGVAVLASSSASELSQESEQLRSSYFTHHLLVGLRGAGDANGDGQVSIDEAYRYAYHQTLLATAETAVGGQHVTFEADLKGHGEVPLSFPRAATSTIELPAALAGQALVEDKRSHTVIAETYKAKGVAVRIAVAPGEYDVLVREGDTLSHCDVDAGGVVELDRCRREAIVDERTKGGEFGETGRRWRFELTGALGGERNDAYTQSLKTFGYQQNLFQVSQGVDLTALRRIWHIVSAGVMVSGIDMPEWSRSVTGSTLSQRFDWQTYSLMAIVHGESALSRRWSYYADLGAGLGVGRTQLHDAEAMEYSNTYFGPAFTIRSGLHLDDIFVKGIGVSAGIGFDYAPVISDLIGNTHASGGERFYLSLTYSR